jgi:hypothetical protein
MIGLSTWRAQEGIKKLFLIAEDDVLNARHEPDL